MSITPPPQNGLIPATSLTFDMRLARPFIHKSLSEGTRSAYRRPIREFFYERGYDRRAVKWENYD